MEYRIFIPFVNGRDLLERALSSIQASKTIIIDNSESYELYSDESFQKRYQVLCPPIPLSFSQIMNYINKISENMNLDVYLFMHNDAEVVGDGFERLIATIPTLPGNWGVAFTNYDLLAAYNMVAVRKVGLWDWKRW